MKANPGLVAFNAGEMSPLLDGRVDLEQRGRGCRTLENWIPLVQGPVTKRPGTKFVAAARGEGRLIPFTFSTTQSYVLEFSNLVMRVFKDGAIVTQTAQDITGISRANPAVVTYDGADAYANGDRIIITGVVGMVEVNNREFTVANVNAGANTFELSGVDSSAYTAWASGGTVAEIYELTTPYTTAHLSALQYAQSADTMYIVHPSLAPYKLTRAGHTAWTLTSITFVDGPYLDYDPDSGITLTPSARTGAGITVTASSALFDTTNHVGSIWRLGYDAETAGDVAWGYVTFTAVASSTSATATVSKELGAQLFSDYSFDEGISGWSDKSTNVASTVTHDSTNKRLNLTQGAAGIAYTEKSSAVTPGVLYTLVLDVNAVPTASRITIGTTSGGSQILGWTALGTGTVTHNFTSTTDTVYVGIDTTGANNGDVTRINSISLTRKSLVTGKWREGAWSLERGYPSVITLFEERVVYAATSHQPQTLFASVAGDFEEFTPTDRETGQVNDDHGITRTLSADEVNVIRWIAPSSSLVVGTVGGEWRIVTGSDQPWTPTNGRARLEGGAGSAAIRPLRIGNTIVMVQYHARQVFALGYSYDIDGLTAEDLTELADHIATGGIVAMVYQRRPWSIIWCARTDGTLISCTFRPDQKVVGWASQPIAGAFGTGNAVVESLACIPGTSGQDELWMVVKRTVNSATVRYIEQLQPALARDGDIATDAYYLDSLLQYSGASSATMTGATHLVGQTVGVLGGGAVQTAKTVAAGGRVTLDKAVEEAVIGLPITSTMIPQRTEIQTQAGGIQTMQRRVVKVTARLDRTIGLKVGPSETVLDTLPWRKGGDPMDAPPPLFTGDKAVDFRGSHSTSLDICIVHDYPTPATVLALFPEFTIGS